MLFFKAPHFDSCYTCSFINCWKSICRII